MRLKITASLSSDELEELVATEMRRRFNMPRAEITLHVKSWGEAEVTITEAESEPAPLNSEEAA